MEIQITNAVQSTWIVIGGLAAAAVATARKRAKDPAPLPVGVTQELKGVAMLAIVLGHIGYFLVSDHRFLYPLSTAAGVGVDMFLLLSGFGLTASMINNRLSITGFYRRRLIKVFIPFWLALTGFFLADAFILKRQFPLEYMIRSYLGVFLRADINLDINSPFWYISLILFYYVLFPAVFMAGRVWLSALLLFVLGQAVVIAQPSLFSGVIHLFRLHTAAFPLGMLLASLFAERPSGKNDFIRAFNQFRERGVPANYAMVILLSIGIVCYHVVDSGVGQGVLKEQSMSLLTSLAFVLLFSLKRYDLGVFSLFGLYSYEMYLLHWPLLFRYDWFYHNLPAWAATFAYLALFIGLGWAMQRITNPVGKLLDRR